MLREVSNPGVRVLAVYSVKVTGIDWDTDGEPVADLPAEMEFDVETTEDDPSEMELNDAMTEHMSNSTGWCVNSFVISRCEPKAASPAP